MASSVDMPSSRCGRRSRRPGGRAGEREARERAERGHALHDPPRLRPGAVGHQHHRRRRARRRRRGGEGKSTTRPARGAGQVERAPRGAPWSRISVPGSASAAQRAVFVIRSRSLAWRTTTSRNGAVSRGISAHRQNSGGKWQRPQREEGSGTGRPI